MSDNTPFIKAVSFRDSVSKAGLKMRHWTFQEIKEKNGKQVEPGKTAERLYFEQNFGKVTLNALVPGSIEEFKTTPYSTGRKRQESIQVVVFKGERGLNLAANALHYHKAYPYDENGVVYKSEKKQGLSTSNRRNIISSKDSNTPLFSSEKSDTLEFLE